MNGNIESSFKSNLAEYMTTFIYIRSSANIDVRHFHQTFKGFDEHLIAINHNRDYVNKSDYDGWYEKISQNAEVSTIYRKISSLRLLLTFICQQGNECYIPRLPKRHQSSFIPYIFSQDEIATIFSVCDELSLQAKQAKSCLVCIPALIRLLYSTAIRIGEAVNIQMKDIDFNRHVITLHNTKNKCQRYALINTSLENVLKQYIIYRDKLKLDKLKMPDSYLFVSSLGGKCKTDTIQHWFEIIREKAGLQVSENRSRPRLHDLRHTACVHSLEKILALGKDLYCILPILSVFMGHKSIYSTESYLRLTMEFYSGIIESEISTVSEVTKILYRSLNIKSDENI